MPLPPKSLVKKSPAEPKRRRDIGRMIGGEMARVLPSLLEAYRTLLGKYEQLEQRFVQTDISKMSPEQKQKFFQLAGLKADVDEMLPQVNAHVDTAQNVLEQIKKIPPEKLTKTEVDPEWRQAYENLFNILHQRLTPAITQFLQGMAEMAPKEPVQGAVKMIPPTEIVKDAPYEPMPPEDQKFLADFGSRKRLFESAVASFDEVLAEGWEKSKNIAPDKMFKIVKFRNAIRAAKPVVEEAREAYDMAMSAIEMEVNMGGPLTGNLKQLVTLTAKELDSVINLGKRIRMFMKSIGEEREKGGKLFELPFVEGSATLVDEAKLFVWDLIRELEE
jgi:hypothetical protein